MSENYPSLQRFLDGHGGNPAIRREARQALDEIERLRADAQDPRGRIGGFLSYRTSGHNRPCGQIVGAEGGGDFCFLFMGTPEQAHIKAREIVGELKSIGHRLTHVVFVECSPEAGYHGNPVSIIDAAQQEGGRDG